MWVGSQGVSLITDGHPKVPLNDPARLIFGDPYFLHFETTLLQQKYPRIIVGLQINFFAQGTSAAWFKNLLQLFAVWESKKEKHYIT